MPGPPSATGPPLTAPGAPEWYLHHTAGTNHPVWIGEAAQLATPPTNPLHRGTQTAVAGACVATAIILTRRPDAVDIEWPEVAPHWQRRHL
jgi:hypothetical protein